MLIHIPNDDTAVSIIKFYFNQSGGRSADDLIREMPGNGLAVCAEIALDSLDWQTHMDKNFRTSKIRLLREIIKDSRHDAPHTELYRQELRDIEEQQFQDELHEAQLRAACQRLDLIPALI